VLLGLVGVALLFGASYGSMWFAEITVSRDGALERAGTEENNLWWVISGTDSHMSHWLAQRAHRRMHAI